MNQATAKRSISRQAAKGFAQREKRSLSLLSRLWIAASPFLPLLFVVGWLLCRDFLGDDNRFLFTSLLATLATVVLVFFLHRPIEGMLPLVIFFFVFLIGYYLKFYWLVLTLDAGDMPGIMGRFLDWMIQPFLYSKNMLRAFELSTWGFVAFCAAAILSVGLGMTPRGSVGAIKVPQNRTKRLSSAYLTAALAMLLITGVLVYKLGIGIRGRENVRLPFELTGLIHYMRSSLVPSLLILVMAWSDRKGMRAYWWIGLVGLMAFGVSLIFLEASRGALVGAVAIPLGALWLLYRGFTRKRVSLLIVAFLVVVVMRPIFTVYREFRGDIYSDQSLTEMMVQAFQPVESSGQTSWFLDDFMRIALRVIGVDSVLYVAPIQSVKVDLLWVGSVLLGRGNFTQQFTQDIVGYGPYVVTHYTTPSLVGGSYLLGGTGGIVVGVFVIVLAFQWIWARLYRSRWRTAPLALVQVAQFAFSIGSEGVFESMLRDILVAVVLVVGLEFASRIKF
jgi:hypothetical protein